MKSKLYLQLLEDKKHMKKNSFNFGIFFKKDFSYINLIKFFLTLMTYLLRHHSRRKIND